MDLAEIRKKAKSAKAVEELNRSGSAPALQPPSQSVPKARVPDALSGLETALPAPQPAIDPLEALFSARPDIALATEESYLQALRARDEEAAEDLREWLTFSLGREEYALEIGGISEIIKPREITDIPRVPEFILGIISLRGIIIPVYDLKRRLKLGAADIAPASRIIVCQQGERSAGLLVDSISQVVRIPAQGFEPPPAVLTGLDRDLVEGIGRYQGRMLILLDLASVLNAELT